MFNRKYCVFKQPTFHILTVGCYYKRLWKQIKLDNKDKIQNKRTTMNQNELSQLSDEELLEIAKNSKPSPIIDAFFIGFLVGIVIYSVANNFWGFLTLIPLYLIYIFLRKPKKYEALKNELKKRKLE